MGGSSGYCPLCYGSGNPKETAYGDDRTPTLDVDANGVRYCRACDCSDPRWFNPWWPSERPRKWTSRWFAWKVFGSKVL